MSSNTINNLLSQSLALPEISEKNLIQINDDRLSSGNKILILRHQNLDVLNKSLKPLIKFNILSSATLSSHTKIYNSNFVSVPKYDDTSCRKTKADKHVGRVSKESRDQSPTSIGQRPCVDL